MTLLAKIGRTLSSNVAIYTALVAGALASLVAVCVLRGEESFELLANMLILFGAVLIAKGAALTQQSSDKMFAILNATAKDDYAHQSDLLVVKREMLSILERLLAPGAEKERASLIVGMRKEVGEALRGLHTSTPNRLTQDTIAGLFVESSDKSGGGSVLIYAGTLILIGKAIYLIWHACCEHSAAALCHL